MMLAVATDAASVVLRPQQLRDERRGHQRVEVHVQPVEQPAQPRRDAGRLLGGRELAQGPRFHSRAGHRA